MDKIGVGKTIISQETREAVKWWFSDNPKIVAARKAYCARAAQERQQLKDAGSILQYNDVNYTEQDILDGKCPANGILVNMGYIRDGNKWRKK